MIFFKAISGQCKLDSFFSNFLVLNLKSGVDIRSSKVCELGLLNYKAKHVFYPLERSRFRCRYDYYWTSVFKVKLIFI